jgi:hypothetical protein
MYPTGRAAGAGPWEATPQHETSFSEALRGALDSGSDQYKVVCRSAPGNTQPVVVSGGILVDGFDCSSGICSATVPDWPEGQIARQFYVDDVRAIRARSNYDPTASVQRANPVYARADFGYEIPLEGFAPPLSHPEWAEVVTVTQWKMMRCPLLPIPGMSLFPDPQCWWNANTYPEPWNFQLLSWIENAPEYLDQPGMWALRRDDAFEGRRSTPRVPGESRRVARLARVQHPLQRVAVLLRDLVWPEHGRLRLRPERQLHEGARVFTEPLRE